MTRPQTSSPRTPSVRRSRTTLPLTPQHRTQKRLPRPSSQQTRHPPLNAFPPHPGRSSHQGLDPPPDPVANNGAVLPEDARQDHCRGSSTFKFQRLTELIRIEVDTPLENLQGANPTLP